jgi:hypothetical protein
MRHATGDRTMSTASGSVGEGARPLLFGGKVIGFPSRSQGSAANLQPRINDEHVCSGADDRL